MELTTYVSCRLKHSHSSPTKHLSIVSTCIYQRLSTIHCYDSRLGSVESRPLHHVHGLFHGVKRFGLQYLLTHEKTGLNKLLETFLYYSIYFTIFCNIRRIWIRFCKRVRYAVDHTVVKFRWLKLYRFSIKKNFDNRII